MATSLQPTLGMAGLTITRGGTACHHTHSALFFPPMASPYPSPPFSLPTLHHSNPLHTLPRLRFMHPVSPRLPIFASTVGAEQVEIEPTTNVKFPTSILAPGGSSPLSLVGKGYREKSIAFIRVKVYAIGMYFDANISASLASWKGKRGDELSKDASFFKAIAEAPVEKGIRIVLVRDVDGATFWGALDEALTARLKAENAGAAGQEALDAFGEVFRGRSLKQGTSIYLTWVQPFKLQVAVSGGSMVPETVEASIVSAALVSSLFDVYLGENPVSPTAKASIASGLESLL